MAVTRINNNQITDASAGNVLLGINAGTKLQNNSITAGKIANNLTYGSDLTVTGNLTVQGTSTAIDTTIVTIEDPIILLASTATGAPAVDIGFIGDRGDETNIAFVWDESAGEFVTAFTTSNITTTTVAIDSYANFATGSANVTGNIVITGTSSLVGNLIGAVNATGNITGGNIATAGQVSATGNITSAANITGANVLTSGIVSATGTITGGNIATGGNVSATGNITGGNIISGNAVIGNINVSGNITVNSLTSNTFVSASGNVIGGNVTTVGLVSATGTITSDATITGGNLATGGTVSATGTITGGNLATGGTASVGGNITGANILTGGTVSATGNVTSGNVNTAGNINATGEITGGNVFTGGLISATGDITGGSLTTSGTANVTGTITGGNISSLGFLSAVGTATVGNLATAGTASAGGNITGANILTGGIVSSTGTVTGGNLATGGTASATGTVTGGNLATGGTVSATGNITGSYFFGNGSQLTGVIAESANAEALTGTFLASNVIGSSLTSVGDLTSLSVVGTTQSGNLQTAGLVSATGTVTGGNLATGGTASAGGNVTGANILTGGIVSATGNITGGNVNAPQVYGSSTLSLIAGTGNINLETTGNVVLANTFINGVAYPVQNQDAASKIYVDNLVSTGISYHEEVVASTTVDLATATGGTVTYAQPNGAANGVGATLTTTGSFNLIDTANVQSPGTRILVKNQANAVQNGVYVWSNATVITRATSEDTYGVGNAFLFGLNDYFFTTSGNVNAGAAFIVDAPSGVITFGTSEIQFAQFSSSQVYSANTAAGISLSGTVFSAKVDNNTTAFDGLGNISIKAGANLTTPNIGAATGTSLSTTGTITGGNLATGGTASATGTVTGGNLATGGTVSATGNILTGGIVSATGNITGNYFIGNGSQLTGVIAESANAETLTGTFLAPTVVGSSLTSVGELTNLSVVGTTQTGNLATSGTVSATGTVTGGNLATGGTASAGGTITGGNLATGGTVSATGTATAGNVLTGGLVSATGNVTGANIVTGGLITSTGNITGGNVLTGGLVSAAGTVTGGNLATGGTASITGTATMGNVATGGTISATATITGGNIATGGTVSATGNVTGGNILSGGLGSFTGNVTAANFIGNITGNISAAGANTQVEFNDSGITNATAGFTFDKTSNLVTVGGNVNASNFNGNVFGTSVSASGTVTAASTVGGVITGSSASVTGTVTGGNLATGGTISGTGNITGGNIATAGQLQGGNIVISGDDITDTNGRVNFNTAGADVDFAVNGDTVANVFYVDAGTGTASFGSATQTVNAIVAFNSTNSILAPVGNTAQRPATGVTGMVRFNSTNNNLELYDNSQWTAVGVPEFTVITNEQFFGDGSTVAFTLGSTQTTNSCIVSINGVVQIPITSYSVAGTDPTCVLTFTEAPAPGDAIEVRQITTTTSVTSISNASGNAVIAVSDSTNDVVITGDLVPTGNLTQDLGSATNQWGDLYLSGNSIILGNTVIKNTGGNTIGFFGPNGTTPATIDAVSIDTSAITKTGSNGVGNIGQSDNSFNTVFAKATSAQYADLAEKYTADAEYAPGTVVVFGGTAEVTVDAQDADSRVAGVVSTHPAYIMNDGLSAAFVATVALTGRVPCLVTGLVHKGDLMVAAGLGRARAEADPRVGTVIGKALEDFDGEAGTIEVVVGRF
jgi:hypothetical protein